MVLLRLKSNGLVGKKIWMAGRGLFLMEGIG